MDTLSGLFLVLIIGMGFLLQKLRHDKVKLEDDKHELCMALAQEKKLQLTKDLVKLNVENQHSNVEIQRLHGQFCDVTEARIRFLEAQVSSLERQNKLLDDQIVILRRWGGEPVQVEQSTKIAQSQCTYSSLRGVTKPSFEFLRRGEDGSWDA